MSNLHLESNPDLKSDRSSIVHFRIALALVAVVGLGSMMFRADQAQAYTAGSSAGQTLNGYNWDTFQYFSANYTAQSSVQYTKIFNGSWYTRVDSAFHQSKTNSNWYSMSPYLSSAGVWTTTYSGGVYMITLHSLNGTCTGPTWTAWWCDSGTLSLTFLGNGTANWTGYMSIGGGGWGTLSGGSVSGSYAWSAP